MNEPPKPAETTEERPPEHQLPAGFIFVLCAALGGGLPAGIFTTLVSEPGVQAGRGNPIYGLLLPWGILPFFVVIVAGWRGRFSLAVRRLGVFTTLAAVFGLLAYSYAFFVMPKMDDARRWFLFVPLWQWALIAMPAMRCLLAPPPKD